MQTVKIQGPGAWQKPGRIRVVDVLEFARTADLRTRAETAAIERARLFELFAKDYGELEIEALAGIHLVEFIQRHVGSCAQWTKRRWSTTIKAGFNLACRLGMIRANPLAGVTYGVGDRGRDLTDSEFRTLLKSTTAVFRRVLTFLRFSGARPAELRDLEWDQVRLPTRSIVLRKHKTVGRTQRPRVIYLNTPTIKLLAWIRRRQDPSQRRVFLNAFGDPWQTRSLCKRLAELRERMGLSDEVKLYGCRHTFATAAILNHVDPATLAELMGHASIKTTEWYVHLSGKSGHLAAAAEQAIGKKGGG